MLRKKQEAQRHDRHPSDKAVQAKRVVSAFLGGRQDLIDTDIYHYSRSGSKYYAEYGVGHTVPSDAAGSGGKNRIYLRN